MKRVRKFPILQFPSTVSAGTRICLAFFLLDHVKVDPEIDNL